MSDEPKHVSTEKRPLTLLGDKTYGFMKQLVLIVLPAFGVFYSTISDTWGLPYGDEIVGTCAALSLFLGVALNISSRTYVNSGAKYDGTMLIDKGNTTEDGQTFQLNGMSIDGNLSDIHKKGELTLKVNPQD